MERIVVDAELRKKLRNLAEPLELVDEAGITVAVVEVRPNGRPWAPPPPTPEELEEMSGEPDYSPEEVMAYLRSL